MEFAFVFDVAHAQIVDMVGYADAEIRVENAGEVRRRVTHRFCRRIEVDILIIMRENVAEQFADERVLVRAVAFYERERLIDEREKEFDRRIENFFRIIVRKVVPRDFAQPIA